MIKVGIYGATGYTGYELVQLLGRHPSAEVVFVTSESSADLLLSAIYPQAPAWKLVSAESAPLDTVDVVFLCLPHAESAPVAVRALAAGVRVIDLSADFRLNSAELYEKWYGIKHPAPELLSQAVYGLTEFVREQLPTAQLVANPGCYPTTILLGLKPILQAGLATGTIIADSKSGVTGAGRKAKIEYHLVELGENFYPYGIGRKHRHLPEIEQEMKHISADAPALIFSPHLLPVPRGILSTIYVPTSADFNTIYNLYAEAYAGEPFVKLLPQGSMATLGHVVRTNRCVISLHQTDGMIIIVSAEDNLVKGAAGQAVQNMNVMFGLPETSGLC